jgi:hypothetical protein
VLQGEGEQLSIQAMSIDRSSVLPNLEVVQIFPSALERQPGLLNGLFIGQVNRKFLDQYDLSALHRIAPHLPDLLSDAVSRIRGEENGLPIC